MSKMMDDGTVLRFSDMVQKAREEGERRGTNDYAKKFSLEVLKCSDSKGNLFTVYICCTPEEQKEILDNQNKDGVSLRKYQDSGNIVSIKRGHDISPEEDQRVRDYYGYHFLRNKKMKETFPSEAIKKIVSEGKKAVNSDIYDEKVEDSPRIKAPTFHEQKESGEGFGR